MPFSDPEKRREYHRKYMARKRASGTRQDSAEAQEFREQEAEQKADWYQRNKERKAENQRKWRKRKRK